MCLILYMGTNNDFKNRYGIIPIWTEALMEQKDIVQKVSYTHQVSKTSSRTPDINPFDIINDLMIYIIMHNHTPHTHRTHHNTHILLLLWVSSNADRSWITTANLHHLHHFAFSRFHIQQNKKKKTTCGGGGEPLPHLLKLFLFFV